MKLFGTSGIRRIADRELLELAFAVGLAVGEEYRSAAVGRDTRTSGDAMKHALCAGLLAAGASVYDAGTVPTPTLALAAGRMAAGAMLTASHNPPEYNGIKLFNPDGSAFDEDQQKRIEERVAGGGLKAARWEDMKESGVIESAVEDHIRHIMNDIPETAPLKVVLDCGCGAASVITPELLARLGCKVTAINSYPTGFFPREVEPKEENLGTLINAVRETGADLGIAHDGDADRMMAVDDKGRFVPGDKLLALFPLQMKAGSVVTTIDASMAIDEMGFSVGRTPVGDSFVSVALKGGGEYGGEPSGSWIFPANSLCPDGIYAAARLARIAGEHRLSGLIDEIPQYPIMRGSVGGRLESVSELEAALRELKPSSVDTIDGIKISFPDSWLLARPSGTEPKIRLTVEARNERDARDLYNEGMDIINNLVKQKVAG